MNHLIPSTREDLITAIQIYRSPRIGPASYYRLTASVDSFAAAREKLLKTVKERNITGFELGDRDKTIAEIDTAKELGARIVFNGHKNYPPTLSELSTAPPFFWFVGNAEILARPKLAIVGTRNPSIEGIRVTASMARAATAMGFAVVSGHARGIDTAAHQNALADGTIAVVAGGIDICYPRENAELYENIKSHGVVVSEMPFGHQPQASNFPQRNRIIAGLSQAVLVPEAAIKSGTALTVNDAIDLNRDILAIPGHPFHGLSNLPNQLIKDGAILIRDAADLEAALIGSKSATAAGDASLELPTPRASGELSSTERGSMALQKIGEQLIESAAQGNAKFFLT